MRLDEPLGAQLSLRLRDLILHGRLRAGTRLPSSRTLARRLAISRNTVLFAYEELAAAELLIGKVGSGTYVGGRARTLTLRDPDGLAIPFAALASRGGHTRMAE